MIIDIEKAKEIAEDAQNNAGFSITTFAGYYTIYENDENSEDNIAVAISKANEDGNEFFDIYVSDNTNEDESYWDVTKTLDTNELANKLYQIALSHMS